MQSFPKARHSAGFLGSSSTFGDRCRLMVVIATRTELNFRRSCCHSCPQPCLNLALEHEQVNALKDRAARSFSDSIEAGLHRFNVGRSDEEPFWGFRSALLYSMHRDHK